MKKSIAVFVKNLTSGGAEKQSVLLAKSMTYDYRVHYIIFNGKHIHQKYLDMLKEDKSIQIVAFHGGIFSRFLQLVRYIKRQQLDVILSYLTAANFFACIAGMITRAKIITGLRNAELPWAKLWADRFLTNHLANLTICNCYSGKENFCHRGFSCSKIVVIPNCFEYISPYIAKPPHEEIRVITVGRFVAQKDYKTAIQTIKLAAEQCQELRFTIVGYGELEQQVRDWITEYSLEHITTVYINPDNITQLLDDSDIYLSTSLFEGTSNSIMEGMNGNLPIVATNVGDNCKLVEDGKNGYLHPIEDVAGLSTSLVQLCTCHEQRRAMGEASKELLAKNYSVSIFKNRYHSLIKWLT